MARAFNNLGISGARVIRAGSITQSVMRVRMNALDANAMPPLDKTTLTATLSRFLIMDFESDECAVAGDGCGYQWFVYPRARRSRMNYTLQDTANFASGLR